MRVISWGTRGSTPVFSRNQVKYGGNSTCVQVLSQCLPLGMGLFLDAGSGIVPASMEFLKSGGKHVVIDHSHYHHDHTQGLPLSAFPYVPTLQVDIFGPEDNGKGPKWVYQQIMQPPMFPVPLKKVIGNHMRFRGMELPECNVQLFHPEGGVKLLDLPAFEKFEATEAQVPFQDGDKYPLSECLVVRMHRTDHPEQAISFRLEERPTGIVFVFVTDHECQVGFPDTFKKHLLGADLLIEDCQYSPERYTKTAGFGHATPDYVAMVAREAGVKAVGLTHHDPPASDEFVDNMVASVQKNLRDKECNIPVFGCRDYMAVEVGDTTTYPQD